VSGPVGPPLVLASVHPRCSQWLGRSFGTGGKVSQLGIFCDLLSVFPHSAGIYIKPHFADLTSILLPYLCSVVSLHLWCFPHSLQAFDTPGRVGSISGFSQARKAIYYTAHFSIMQVLFRSAHTVPWLQESDKSASAGISSQQKPMLHYQL